MNKYTRMELDARTLGLLTRNLAAIPMMSPELKARIEKLQSDILKRYNATDVMGCLLMIAMRIRSED